MDKVKEVVGDVLRAIDCFSFPVYLRYNQLPKYSTRTGGLISMGLLITLISVFYNAWFDILDKKTIYSTLQNIRQSDPSNLIVNSTQFTFALGVIGIDLNSNNPRYFDLLAQAYFRDNNKKMLIERIPLVKCTLGMWSKFGVEFSQRFNSFQLEQFLCPSQNYSMLLAGKYTSSQFAYLKISFNYCSGNNCRTQQEFNGYLKKNRAFLLDFFYVNNLIDSSKYQPITTVFDDKDYIMVSDKLGTDMNIYLSQYIIDTDQSLSPFSNHQLRKGITIDKTQNQKWNYIPNDNTLSKIYLRKSDNKIQVSRTFRKLDDMLSYIGGLFGSLVAAFGFILKFYSQCSLQLKIAHNMFIYEDPLSKFNDSPSQSSNNSNQYNEGESQISMKKSIPQECFNKDMEGKEIIKQDKEEKEEKEQEKEILEEQVTSFNFISYIQYLAFLGLRLIGINVRWKQFQIYEEALTQTRNQIDINTLLQKVIFYDKALHTLFDQDQLKLLYMQEKFNIQEIKNERQMLELRKDIKNGFNNNLTNNFVKATIKNNQVVDQYYLTRQLRRISASRSTLPPLSFLSQRRSVLEITHSSNPKIPPEIVKAIENLKIKMAKGDKLSQKIFEGLQPQLMRMFDEEEKRKINKKTQMKKNDKCSDYESGYQQK